MLEVKWRLVWGGALQPTQVCVVQHGMLVAFQALLHVSHRALSAHSALLHESHFLEGSCTLQERLALAGKSSVRRPLPLPTGGCCLSHSCSKCLRANVCQVHPRDCISAEETRRVGPPLVCINKVLLKYGHSHSCMYCLWLPSCSSRSIG